MNTATYHDICQYLRQLIEGTQWQRNVYAVGGCIRDMLMGEPIKDIDLAVSLPDGGIAFAEWLKERGLTSGEVVEFVKYGTARMHLRRFPSDEIELVQTRREKYDDRTKRDPSIAFGSVEEDCVRRDLTINSLYQNLSTGEILDITGRGRADIEARLIRTPMDPDTTFDDDPVRILRAIRFAARFDSEIDATTLEAMKRHVDRLSIISPERMQGEFEKILTCPYPGRALELLRTVGAIRYIIPELEATFDMPQPPYHAGTVWEHTLLTVDKVAPTPLMRTAALLHDIGKTVAFTRDDTGAIRFPRHDRRAKGIIVGVMSRLRYRNDFINKVLFLCLHHEAAKSWGPLAEKMTDADLRRLQHLCRTHQRLNNLLDLIDADNRSYAPDHCMPEQVHYIRKREDTLRREGTAGYNYSLPLKPSRISRIIGTRNESAIEAALRFLMDYGLANPTMTREEMAALLQDNIAQLDLKGSVQQNVKSATGDTPGQEKKKKKHRGGKRGH